MTLEIYKKKGGQANNNTNGRLVTLIKIYFVQPNGITINGVWMQKIRASSKRALEI